MKEVLFWVGEEREDWGERGREREREREVSANRSYLWLNVGCEVVPTEASFEWQYHSILHGSGAWLGQEGCGQHCPLAQSWHQT